MDALNALRTIVSPVLRGAGSPIEAPEAPMAPGALDRIGEGQMLRSVGAADKSKSFANVLGDLVQEVNGRQTAASQAVNGLLSGQNVSLHQTMIAVEEASVSFQLMVEVRNKLLESYQELMRMQV